MEEEGTTKDSILDEVLEHENVSPEMMEMLCNLGTSTIPNLIGFFGDGEKLTLSDIPKGNGEYLHEHTNSDEELGTSKLPDKANSKLPRSFWSNRKWLEREGITKEQRLEANLSEKNSIELVSPLDPESLMGNLMPINERRIKSGDDTKTNLNKDRLTVLEEIPTMEGVFSQCQDLSSVGGIWKCEDRDGNPVYVDTDASMPLAKKHKGHNNTGVYPTHYYKVGDYMEFDEVKKVVDVCGQYNSDIVPVVLLILLRYRANEKKGKREMKASFKHDNDLYEMEENQKQLHKLEKYLIRLLITTVACLSSGDHGLSKAHLDRFNWYDWSFASIDRYWEDECATEREETKAMAKASSKLRLLHALRIVLHSQKR